MWKSHRIHVPTRGLFVVFVADELMSISAMKGESDSGKAT